MGRGEFKTSTLGIIKRGGEPTHALEGGGRGGRKREIDGKMEEEEEEEEKERKKGGRGRKRVIMRISREMYLWQT